MGINRFELKAIEDCDRTKHLPPVITGLNNVFCKPIAHAMGYMLSPFATAKVLRNISEI